MARAWWLTGRGFILMEVCTHHSEGSGRCELGLGRGGGCLSLPRFRGGKHPSISSLGCAVSTPGGAPSGLRTQPERTPSSEEAGGGLSVRSWQAAGCSASPPPQLSVVWGPQPSREDFQPEAASSFLLQGLQGSPSEDGINLGF